MEHHQENAIDDQGMYEEAHHMHVENQGEAVHHENGEIVGNLDQNGEEVIHEGGVVGEEETMHVEHGEEDHQVEGTGEMVGGVGKRSRVKRRRTGYMFYVQENRKRVTEENLDLTFGQISTKVSAMWKALGPEERVPFEMKANEDKERWLQERANHPDGVPQRQAPQPRIDELQEEEEHQGPKKRGRKKKPRKWTKEVGAPNKAMTPYIAFGKSVRPAITISMLEEEPSTKPTDIMKEISTRWKKLTAEERVPFEEEANKDKIRYEEAKTAWLARRPVEDRPAKRIKRQDGEPVRPRRVVKVRAHGETDYDKITITAEMSFQKLVQKILQKRQEADPTRTINYIIQLPDVRLRDAEDIALLPHEAELEFIWGESEQNFHPIIEEEMEHHEMAPDVAVEDPNQDHHDHDQHHHQMEAPPVGEVAPPLQKTRRGRSAKA